MTDPWDDDELDRLMEMFRDLCDKSTSSRFDETVEAITFDPPPEVKPGQVVLYGLEGQVDAVWDVPEPFPDVLLRPKLQRVTLDPGPPTLDLPTIEYRRIGEHTYVREDKHG